MTDANLRTTKWSGIRVGRPGIRWLGAALGWAVVMVGLILGWRAAAGAMPWADALGRAAAGLLGAAGVALGAAGVYRVSGRDFGATRVIGLAAALAMALGGVDAAFAGLWGFPLSSTIVGIVVGLSLGISVVFLLLITLARLALRVNLATLAVARQVLDETLRMKVALVFLVALVLAISAMPFIVGDNDALRYRVQQFLAYSLGLTGLLLGLMTIFAACSTLSGEIEGKQAFTVMTKPIDRGRYLLGKWLGLTLLNAVLLAVAGGAIYGFVMLHMVRQPAMDALDRASLHERVLTARVAVAPTLPSMSRDEAEQWVERFLRETGDSAAARDLVDSLGGRGALVRGLTRHGEVQARALERLRDQLLGGGAAFINEEGGTRAALKSIRRRLITQQRSMGPRGRQHSSARFIFNGLGRAKQLGRSVQLQFKLSGSGGVGQATRIGWRANGRTVGVEQYPLDIEQTLMLPVEMIDEDGRLVVEAHNLNPAGSVTFDRDDGVQLFYAAGRFGPNLGRGLAMMLVKLAFLAALGLTAATFLGFPVASLLALLVFAAAAASPFILESIGNFGTTPEGPTLLARFVNLIAGGVGQALRQFAAFQPSAAITHGRMIGWATLGLCVGWIGVLWTGLTFLIGWVIFRKRELARVQV